MLETILIIVLVFALLGAVPAWPYSAGWGWGPGGIVGIILVIFLILVVTGKVRADELSPLPSHATVFLGPVDET